MHAERANRGQLMLTEATVVSEHGHGVPNTPGIYTVEQREAWRPIVHAVHAKGAFFFCQLWHCGRVSHSIYNPGETPKLLSEALRPSATHPPRISVNSV